MAGNDKTVVRVVKRENPFVQIDKTPINDERLSWKAKGLLVYLISKPDDWTIMVADLIKRAKDGRDSVYAGLKELETAGYLSRRRERDENGKFLPMEYTVYETPQHRDLFEVEPLPENPDTGDSATSGKSGYGKSRYGKSRSGKSATTNKENTTNNESTNTEDNNNKGEVVVVPESIRLFCSEREIPVSDGTIRGWMKLADEKTILQAINEALGKKKQIGTVVGYVTGMLKRGYTPSVQIDGARVMEDKLPESVLRQQELEKAEKEAAAADEAKSIEDDPELKSMLEQLRRPKG